jgi:2-amino-4-hydroxy-6-hydroxymethyldihydropteridine diphosphokinase
MMTQVYLGLGANIKPQASLQAGVAELREQFGAIDLSPVYLAPAIGMNGPDFLNMVVGIACPMSHSELMTWIRKVEAKHGRVRSAAVNHKPTSHGLDMDVLLFGELVDSALKVPRPDILTCAYVLQPLADLAPNLVHPCSGKNMVQLHSSCPPAQHLTPVQLTF